MTYGVLFDMDGVLVDSGPPHLESWQILARRHGIDVSPERFSQCFGRPSRDIVRIIWGGGLSDEEVRELDAEKEVAYRALITGRVPLMPDCREVVEALHTAGIRLAVATSGPPENLDLVLSEGRIAGYFDATVNGFEIAHGKPAPDCFLLAAERIRLPAAQCVVIEDAPVGIQAARAAGMRAIALLGTHATSLLVAAGAVRVVARLREITPPLIEAVLRGR